MRQCGVSFAGDEQCYALLPEGASVNANTYAANHVVWMGRDTCTDTPCLANGQSLFHVKPTRLEDSSSHSFRLLVRITYPLLTLREIASNVTRDAYRPRLGVSNNSTKGMAVELKNMTPSDVSIMWVRSDGHQMQYGVVSAKHADSGSAPGRLAEETLNGLRLLIDGRRHYVAVTPGHSVASLQIRAPLYSLAGRCDKRSTSPQLPPNSTCLLHCCVT